MFYYFTQYVYALCHQHLTTVKLPKDFCWQGCALSFSCQPNNLFTCLDLNMFAIHRQLPTIPDCPSHRKLFL
jgi:hypothetical protein